jgi:methylated-DNA-[protein]-cysteine S-methyltransferase
VRVEQTSYEVPSWGVGELWTSDGVVLAHDFTFRAVSDTSPDAEGAVSPTNGAPGVSHQLGITRRDAGSACGAIDTDLARVSLDTNRCLTPEELAERFAAFFRGDEVDLGDVALDLSWTTPFQRAVADTLRAVPRGEVVSYGELAALVGHPGAQRAVGTFCARNRFMLLVPCHRVVGADGIGGYGSAGISVKRRLLALEGVTL